MLGASRPFPTVMVERVPDDFTFQLLRTRLGENLAEPLKKKRGRWRHSPRSKLAGSPNSSTGPEAFKGRPRQQPSSWGSAGSCEISLSPPALIRRHRQRRRRGEISRRMDRRRPADDYLCRWTFAGSGPGSESTGAFLRDRDAADCYGWPPEPENLKRAAARKLPLARPARLAGRVLRRQERMGAPKWFARGQ